MSGIKDYPDSVYIVVVFRDSGGTISDYFRAHMQASLKPVCILTDYCFALDYFKHHAG